MIVNKYWSIFAPPMPTAKPETDHLQNDIKLERRYDSFDKYNPDQYEKGSADWSNAMMHYLLDMKMNGENIKDSNHFSVSHPK